MPPEGSGIAIEPVEADAERRFDRRTAILRAGCFAVAAMVPGSAQALVGARSRVPALSQLLSQSPIDLRPDDITFVSRLPRIAFAYPRRVDVTLRNTGAGEFDTVRAELPDSSAHMLLGGVRWDLVQFHWHTPSEHELDGRDTPLEMHFVHMNAGGGLLVIGVFIERGGKNRALEPMFSELPEPGDTSSVSGVRLRRLLPEGRESFRYSGSLTTPPFTEPVRWIVLADSIRVSRRQVGTFQELFEEGNSREVQPLNGRQVLSDAKDVFHGEDDDDD
jgi:carbonic anhydrase